MAQVTKFWIRENDDGQELHFKLVDSDGNGIDLTGSTLTFEAYLGGSSAFVVEDETHVTMPLQAGSDVGHCYYTTQVGDFDDASAGIHWCRIKVDNITSTEVELEVKDEYSSGE